MSGLTPEEIAFFETGDASALTAAAPTPAPIEAPAPVPAPVEAPAPAPTPAPVAVDTAAQLQAQLAADTRARAQLEASVARLTEQLNKATAAPAPVEPDAAQDPLGAMFHKLNKITEEVASLKQAATAEQQQATATTEFNSFVAGLQQQRTEFAKTQTDFADAYAHLREARAADLRDVGVPEDKIAQAILQDEIAVSYNAIQQGKNPAQIIYNMAKRYGYTSKAAAAPTPAAPLTPSEKIAQLNKGAEAAVAPARSGGEAALTFEGLRDAGDSELNKMVQDDKLWKTLVGNTQHDIF